MAAFFARAGTAANTHPRSHVEAVPGTSVVDGSLLQSRRSFPLPSAVSTVRMGRLLFPILALCALFVGVRVLSSTLGRPAIAERYEFTDAGATLDVDALRSRTKNPVLRLATPEELQRLRTTPVLKLVEMVVDGNEHERRLGAATLGVAGHVDGIKPLIDAFKREKEAHVIAVLARSLAETGRNEAIEALIAAIREQKDVAAYEAYRALKETYRVSLSLDANAWQRWLDATRAFRE